ncbi:hypothetical protein [Anaeromyxobacter oryzisoli]|uniref:hypothetical protein n=1 Tax=Anaeromyxobacter oryzisoli TaxID=2925408 RepID=UPI001F569698|nr:hypothetical protein [Anaeromyxobacter sp. SG63]
MSRKQHNAMEAAAHGDGTIGIPKPVGKEFIAADKVKGKKHSTKAMAAALRRKRAPEPDQDEEELGG